MGESPSFLRNVNLDLSLKSLVITESSKFWNDPIKSRDCKLSGAAAFILALYILFWRKELHQYGYDSMQCLSGCGAFTGIIVKKQDL